MAKIELNEETKLTAEIIEALKGFATATEDGKLFLDTETLKTQTDVDNVMRSKKNADAELGGVKKQLTEVQGKLKAYTDVFGENGDPSQISAELEEFRKGSEGIQARLIEATQSAKAWEKKFNDQQPEFEKYRLAAEKQAQRELTDKINSIWAKKLEKLDPKWDKSKANTFFGNIVDNVKLADDDPEDFAPMKNGQSFEDYINSQLDLLGAYTRVSGGGGDPGNGKPANGSVPKNMFEQAASQIKFN